MRRLVIGLAAVTVAVAVIPPRAEARCNQRLNTCPFKAYLPSAERAPSPTPRPTATRTPLPTQAPPPTQTPRPLVVGLIGGPHHYQAADNQAMVVVGEVRNDTAAAVDSVKITANVWRSNTLLDTEFTYVEPSYLDRATTTCFRITFDSPLADRTRTTYEIGYDEAYSEYRRLETNGVSGKKVLRYDGRYTYEILGNVRNGTGTAVEYAKVVSTAYGLYGGPVDCEYTYANTSALGVGQSSTFKLEHWGYRRDFSDVTRFSVSAIGWVP